MSDSLEYIKNAKVSYLLNDGKVGVITPLTWPLKSHIILTEVNDLYKINDNVKYIHFNNWRLCNSIQASDNTKVSIKENLVYYFNSKIKAKNVHLNFVTESHLNFFNVDINDISDNVTISNTFDDYLKVDVNKANDVYVSGDVFNTKLSFEANNVFIENSVVDDLTLDCSTKKMFFANVEGRVIDISSTATSIEFSDTFINFINPVKFSKCSKPQVLSSLLLCDSIFMLKNYRLGSINSGTVITGKTFDNENINLLRIRLTDTLKLLKDNLVNINESQLVDANKKYEDTVKSLDLKLQSFKEGLGKSKVKTYF